MTSEKSGFVDPEFYKHWWKPTGKMWAKFVCAHAAAEIAEIMKDGQDLDRPIWDGDTDQTAACVEMHTSQIFEETYGRFFRNPAWIKDALWWASRPRWDQRNINLITQVSQRDFQSIWKNGVREDPPQWNHKTSVSYRRVRSWHDQFLSVENKRVQMLNSIQWAGQQEIQGLPDFESKRLLEASAAAITDTAAVERSDNRSGLHYGSQEAASQGDYRNVKAKGEQAAEIGTKQSQKRAAPAIELPLGPAPKRMAPDITTVPGTRWRPKEPAAPAVGTLVPRPPP